MKTSDTVNIPVSTPTLFMLGDTMRHKLIVATTAGLAAAIWLSSACMFAAEYTKSERSVKVSGEAQPVPYLLLVPPERPNDGKHPLIVYLYGSGGSIYDSKEKINYNLGRPPYAKLRQLAAERGYYILVPELGGNHWMNDRAARSLDAIIDHATANNPIDPKRVHLMGTSMGGGSSLAYAIHRPDLVRSVCALCPMTDFPQWVKENPEYLGPITAAYGGSPTQIPAAWAKTSAMRHLTTFKNIPVFLVHGATDTIVNPDNSRLLAKALQAKHYRVVFHEVEGLGHRDLIVEPFQEEIVDFFDHVGLNAAKTPSERITP
jgi:dipeptidyl aminopeptidase/acylaminoacyl peptidase